MPGAYPLTRFIDSLAHSALDAHHTLYSREAEQDHIAMHFSVEGNGHTVSELRLSIPKKHWKEFRRLLNEHETKHEKVIHSDETPSKDDSVHVLVFRRLDGNAWLINRCLKTWAVVHLRMATQ